MLRRTRYTAAWARAAETTDECLNIIVPAAGCAEAAIGTKATVAPPLTAVLTPAPLLRHIRLNCGDGEYASVTLLLEAGIVSRVLSAL